MGLNRLSGSNGPTLVETQAPRHASEIQQLHGKPELVAHDQFVLLVDMKVEQSRVFG
ncbi:hypothetical protein D3C73_1652630 [compost metagenome]